MYLTKKWRTGCSKENDPSIFLTAGCRSGAVAACYFIILRTALSDKDKTLPARQKSWSVQRKSVPARTQSLPARQNSLSVRRKSVPARIQTLSARQNSLSAQRKSAPAKTQTLPAQRKSVPARTQSLPARFYRAKPRLSVPDYTCEAGSRIVMTKPYMTIERNRNNIFPKPNATKTKPIPQKGIK